MNDQVRGRKLHEIETAFINLFIPSVEGKMDDAVQLCVDNTTNFQIGDKNNLYIENTKGGKETIQEIVDVLAPTTVSFYADSRELPTIKEYMEGNTEPSSKPKVESSNPYDQPMVF